LRHSVQRGVEGLVARVPLRFTGVHPAQYAADLLRGMAPAQQSDHLFPQPVAPGATIPEVSGPAGPPAPEPAQHGSHRPAAVDPGHDVWAV
jgi:hypothetical protein